MVRSARAAAAGAYRTGEVMQMSPFIVVEVQGAGD
jgi:hypothetical protein